MRVPVVSDILNANDQIARRTAPHLHDQAFVVNLMASPGAGKTSLILATAARLPRDLRPGVIEGDLASRIDADTVAARGIPVVQINTGGNCHLDAPMIRSALRRAASGGDRSAVHRECRQPGLPGRFDLGADLAVVVASAPEGHDKPYKYPGMFAAADAVLLNKADVVAVFDFDLDFFRRGVEMVNPDVPLFVVSCSGAGMDDWVAWLLARRKR